MPARPRKTGFFSRVKQALTCADSPETEARERELERAIEDLKAAAAAGKITKDELELKLALLNGEARSNGVA